MKKIIILSLAVTGIFLFFSCNKFLDIKPVSNGVADNNTNDTILYKNAEEVEAALAAAYSDFKNEYYQLDYYLNGDAQSDDAYAGADNPSIFQIDDLALDATNSNVSRDWGYLYSTIGKTNGVILNINKVTDPLLTADRKKQIIGEASFIRAFMFFQLVRSWGDCPLQLEYFKSFDITFIDRMFLPKSPAADIYKQIVADLEVAKANVANSYPNKGFATKGAINTLLAYVYATIEPHDWTKVNSYCDEVIAGGYSLLPNYRDLWDNKHKNSSEAIFEINFTGGSTDGNWGTKMFRGLDWKKFNIPSNDLVAAFDAENDTVRKKSSIIFVDVTGHWSDVHYPQTQYPFLNKYPNFAEGSDNDYILYRLADVLLLKAEALNEGAQVTEAAAIVNQIRTRAKLPNTTAADQASMRLAIEKERRLELAFEGHRWWDLKRTGRAIPVMNSVTFNGQTLYNLVQDRLVWPIPQAELDKNSKLVQNPGY
ncbi:MAG: RagB/SusD family nutrient uptake outer membrane protein [Bacteroidota bacterium]